MYFLSIYALFKNEAEIFKEWLEHYLDEGVEHFYLIDNGSDDNFIEVIKPYMDHITLIKDEERGDQTQSKIYNRHILPILEESEWFIGIDLDEFIYTKDGTIASNLKNVDKNIGQILVPWKYFGSSGHIYQPSSVVDSFVYRRKAPYEGAYTKPICRAVSIKEISVHEVIIKDEFITTDPTFNKIDNIPIIMELTDELLDNSIFRMNHYMIQSLDWFRRVKMTRGSSNFSNNHRNEEYFKEWDYNDTLDDELACKKRKQHPIFLILLIIFIIYVIIK